MRGSSTHACAAANGATPSNIAPPKAGNAKRLKLRAARMLWNNHDIAGLQHDVLLQVATASDVGVAERQRLLLSRLQAPQDHDLTQRRKGRGTSRHAQRLHY